VDLPTEIEHDRNWYVASIMPGETQRALTGLATDKIPHCYPRIHVRNEPEPLIRGYVFVGLFGTDEEFSHVRAITGISRLLPVGSEKPLFVREAEMRAFMKRVVAGEFDVRVEHDRLPWFQKDEKLGITSGPFFGHTGTFVRVHKGAVIVRVMFFGRPLEVMLNGHQVQQMM